MHAQEQQEECKYDSDLGQHLTIFSYFSMDQDVHHAYDHFPNHFEHALKDDCIDNYIFLVDHNQMLLILLYNYHMIIFMKRKLSLLMIKSCSRKNKKVIYFQQRGMYALAVIFSESTCF
jgi:hypothetical protein